MEDYRIAVRLLSPLGTPWQSDTVFGHIAWHYAHGRGHCSVEALLEPFREGVPPFVLSDGFPVGLLPRPLLGEPATTQDPEAFDAAKRRRKCRWVSITDFERLIGGDTACWSIVEEPWEVHSTPHAAINRLTESTTGTPEQEAERDAVGEAVGNVYATDVLVLRTAYRNSIDLYVRAEAGWIGHVVDALREIARVGFGRDRATGCGAFEVVGEPARASLGASVPEPDGFVSLSTYCPAAGDPTEGRWRLRVKHGKLGENAGGGDPFKHPLVQLEPGAAFRTPGPPRSYYGRAVEGLAPGLPKAIQCCYTLAVPCQYL